MQQQSYRQPDSRHGEQRAESRQFTQSFLDCDSRYRHIVSQLDLMIEQLRRHPARNLSAELEHLLDVMRDHMDTESRFMELVEFPQAVQHGQRHQFICFHTAILRYRISKGEHLTTGELAHIRSLWLEHIQVQDRAFEEFLVPVHRHPVLVPRSNPIRSSPPS